MELTSGFISQWIRCSTTKILTKQRMRPCLGSIAFLLPASRGGHDGLEGSKSPDHSALFGLTTTRISFQHCAATLHADLICRLALWLDPLAPVIPEPSQLATSVVEYESVGALTMEILEAVLNTTDGTLQSTRILPGPYSYRYHCFKTRVPVRIKQMVAACRAGSRKLPHC